MRVIILGIILLVFPNLYFSIITCLDPRKERVIILFLVGIRPLEHSRLKLTLKSEILLRKNNL